MKRRILAILLSVTLLTAFFAGAVPAQAEFTPAAQAEEDILPETIPTADENITMAPLASGTISNTDTSWRVENNILYIEGGSYIPDYSTGNPAPWNAYDESIKAVNIGSGISQIGEYAFAGLYYVNSVTLPGTVSCIRAHAFDIPPNYEKVVFHGSQAVWDALCEWEYNGHYGICETGNINLSLGVECSGLVETIRIGSDSSFMPLAGHEMYKTLAEDPADEEPVINALSVQRGAGVKVTDAKWQKLRVRAGVTDWVTVGESSGETFSKGSLYRLVLTLSAEDDYSFIRVMANSGTTVEEYYQSRTSFGSYTVEEVTVSTAAKQITVTIAVPVMEAINEVHISGVKQPVAGMSCDITSDLSVPEDAPYTVTSAYWYNPGEEEAESDTILAGETYNLSVEIQPKDGYVFWQLSGANSSLDAALDWINIELGSSFNCADYTGYGIVAEAAEPVVIDEVKISCFSGVRMIVGERMYYWASENDDIEASMLSQLYLEEPYVNQYTLTDLTWYQVVDGTLTACGQEECFAEGTEYSAQIKLTAKANCSFGEVTADDVTMSSPYVKEWAAIEVSAGEDGSTLTVTLSAKTAMIPINEVTAYGFTMPYENQYPDSISKPYAPGAAHYTITDIQWWYADRDVEDEPQIFTRDTDYILSARFVPEEGYVFWKVSNAEIEGLETGIFYNDGYYESKALKVKEISSVIDKVTIHCDSSVQFIVGERMYYEAMIPATDDPLLEGMSLLEPDRTQYELTSLTWYQVVDGTMTACGQEECFAEGTEYFAKIKLTAKDGYSFGGVTTDTVTMNSSYIKDWSALSVDPSSDGSTLTITLSAQKALIPIHEVYAYNVVLPVAGMPVWECGWADVPEDAHYSVTGMYWNYADQALWETTLETFNENDAYSLTVEFTAAEGYVFWDVPSKTVDGLSINGEESGTSDRTVRYVSMPVSARWQGDVNGDGYVNAEDLIAIARHVAGIERLTDPTAIAAGRYAYTAGNNSRDITSWDLAMWTIDMNPNQN